LVFEHDPTWHLIRSGERVLDIGAGTGDADAFLR
jgi:ubiquinone/menaquinone biosynthesis C-methylase UbiE